MKRASAEALLLALALLVAFALRLEVARRFAAEPVWDGHYYEYYARRLADGFGYSDERTLGAVVYAKPSCHYPVGYSAALGVFYKIFGAGAWPRALFGALTGTLTVACGWALARRAFGARSLRTALASTLLVFHPGLVLQSALVMSEGLATASALFALCLCAEQRARQKPWRGALLGAVALGLSALVRPPALLMLPLLLPWRAPFPGFARALSARPWARRAAGLLALICAALLPILPWTARNCIQMDGCALISTNGGWNLAIGIFPRATGRFETLRSSDGCSDVRGQVRQDRCWVEYSLAQLRAAPERFVQLAPKKLHHTFDHESFPIEYLHASAPERWPEARRAWARDALSAWHRALVIAAALCWVRWPRRRVWTPWWRWRSHVHNALMLAALLALAWHGMEQPEPMVWPLALLAALAPWLQRDCPLELRWMGGLLASVALTSVVFFGEDRYHVVATPALCLLACASFRPLAASAPRAEKMV